MSRTYQVQGINLRHHALGESDRIVSIFSREQGLIRAVAKGSKKTTSRLGGRMDLLQCNALELTQGRSLDVVRSAETVRSFGGLRRDYDRLTYALFLAEILNGLLPERHPQPELYDLFAGTLAMMEVFERPDVVALWFQLRALDDLGHRLGLEECHACAIPIPPGALGVAFDLRLGALLCARCRLGREVRPVDAEAIAVLRRLRQVGIDGLIGETPEALLVLACQRVLGEYFSRLLERDLKSLRVLLPAL